MLGFLKGTLEHRQSPPLFLLVPRDMLTPDAERRRQACLSQDRAVEGTAAASRPQVVATSATRGCRAP
jgi:hypothetical protein